MARAPFPKIRVVWHDAFTVDEWTVLADYKIAPTRCVTEGYLVKEDELYIAVAPTLSKNESGGYDACHFIAIPKGMILKMTRRGKVQP